MIAAYQPGIYPRSEAVVAATRGHDRGRVAGAAVEAAYRQDLVDFVTLQQQAGLDFFSDGLIQWQDIFRPLVEASSGMRVGSPTRWFDNNAFFRAPEVNGSVALVAAPPGILPDGIVPRPRVGTLPSPFMFSRAAQTGRDRNQLMLDLTQHLLRPAAVALVSAGCRIIHVQEPWLAYFGIDGSDWATLERCLSSLREGVDATLVLHVYFGDAGPLVDRLRRLPVDAIGIDLVQTDMASLGARWELGLVAGCLDGRSSLIEPLDRTVELVRRLAETVSPPSLYLSSNCDLERLPREVARQKVLRLGEAARRVKELVGR